MSRKHRKKLILGICLFLLGSSLFGQLSFVRGAQTKAAVVTIERFAIGEGFLLEPTTVSFGEGDTYADVFIRACNQAGIAYEAYGSVEEGSFYLSSIKNGDNGSPAIPSCIVQMPEILGMTPPGAAAVNDNAPDLGEFSYHSMAGWQYSVNNSFSDVGMSDTSQLPKAGDVIRVQFTVYGYGADIGNSSIEGALTLADKTKLIQKIAQIRQDETKWFAISGFQQSYQKALQVLETLDASTEQIEKSLAELNTYGAGGQEPSTEEPATEEQTPPGDEVSTEEKLPSKEEEKEELPADNPGNKEKGDKREQAGKMIDSLTEVILQSDKNPDLDSQWRVIGLMRSGREIPESWKKTFYRNALQKLKETDGRLSATKYTEYSKLVLSLTAIGKDASKAGNYNLFTYLSDWEGVKRQGINGPIWALLAVNSDSDYKFVKLEGKTSTTKNRLINEILSRELETGGFALSGTTMDVDITAMAVQALAPYCEKREDVKAVVDRALKALSGAQTKSGGFCQYGTENAESTAQVIMALAALGRDAGTDAEFIKNGNSPMDALLSYYIADKGFSHKAGGAVNAMATEQGYYALVAYERFKDGKTFLYDMSDVKEQPESEEPQQEEPKPEEPEPEEPQQNEPAPETGGTKPEETKPSESAGNEGAQNIITVQNIVSQAKSKGVTPKAETEKPETEGSVNTKSEEEGIRKEAPEKEAPDKVVAQSVDGDKAEKRNARNILSLLFGSIGVCCLAGFGILLWRKKKGLAGEHRYLPRMLCLAGILCVLLCTISIGWSGKQGDAGAPLTDVTEAVYENPNKISDASTKNAPAPENESEKDTIKLENTTEQPQPSEKSSEKEEEQISENSPLTEEMQKPEQIAEAQEEPSQENPAAPEEQQTPGDDKKNVCTLLIDCSVLLQHMEELSEGKTALVPSDGVIYSSTEVEVQEGDSVFSILLREMQANKIHMEYSSNPAYNSAYIEGIANLYEFDCGELSGWMYSVNGEYPNYGCSQYTVKPGDVIEWHYTCDLGKDLGKAVE